MASLIYLQKQADACELLANQVLDRHEAEDLHNLSLVYQNQIRILCSAPPWPKRH